MKLTLTHRNHAPSATIVGMIEKELKSLQPDLQIAEARVHLERSLTDSPPFSASFHLVTPGPDVIVQATDHTLRAALLKAFEAARDKIGHRNLKRARRREAAPAIELTRRRPAGGQRR
ncbi:MAG: HPF/RaiA family ribosome-associated protein [Akkermansiaceae bacterium]|nr:HPF/RaiA family ribosome-associated protein [Akkermansiaceae bacterium]